MSIDPTVLTVIISSISGILGSVAVVLLSQRKTNAEAAKITGEANQLRAKLERGETADIIQFIDIFFQLMDTCYSSIAVLDRIIHEHPEVNGGSRQAIERNRARLKLIHEDMKKYFSA